MGKLRKGLAGLALSGLLTASGCNGFTLGGYAHTNYQGTKLEESIRKKADDLSKSGKIDERVLALKGYGSIGMVKEAREQWEYINNQDLEKGLLYADIILEIEKKYKK